MIAALALGAAALYLLAAGAIGIRLSARASGGPGARDYARGLVVAALLLHAAALYRGMLGADGADLSLFNTASLVMWVAVLGIVLGALAKPLLELGILAFPLAAASVAAASVYSPDAHRPSAGLGIQTHVVVSVLAYSSLTIAACQSVLLAVQERRLRTKSPQRLIGLLPPLKTQETILFQLLNAGFFLLSLSLVSGIMFVHDLFAQHLVHKTVLAITSWCVFAALIWGRWRFGWRGRTATRWCLTGFGLLALAYFGSRLVLELVLGRSWLPG